MLLKLGIDDAGRGPVIGPMILAGCLIDEKTEKEFRRLGVRDSKQLTHKRREFLNKIIKEKAEAYEIETVHPSEIDSKNHSGTNLNYLEALMTANIINRINKGYKKIKVIVDCPSVGIIKWKDFLKTKIDDLSNLEVSCEHKADKNHISVAAASILAKCEREREMDILKKKYGDHVGSGYSSDPYTKKFLQDNIEKLKDKGIFRKTWSTWKKATSKAEQEKLNF